METQFDDQRAYTKALLDSLPRLYHGYSTMDQQSTKRAIDLMRRGALRFFEHSFWLRYGPFVSAPEPSWGCAYSARKRNG